MFLVLSMHIIKGVNSYSFAHLPDKTGISKRDNDVVVRDDGDDGDDDDDHDDNNNDDDVDSGKSGEYLHIFSAGKLHLHFKMSTKRFHKCTAPVSSVCHFS